MLTLKLDASASQYAPQIELLSAIVPVRLADDGLTLSCEASNDGMTVTKQDGHAHIVFEKPCEFFRGILTLMEHEADDTVSLHQKAQFAFNGHMIDNSRNAVLNTKTAKEVIMYSALMGLDNILLYNEETFEVPEHPYFGYMRMGYTKKDVRELNDFAKQFGVTIVPCIQTLAHLAQTLRWACHRDICDAGDTLLVEEEKTYTLIEDVIRSWHDCVDTAVFHIGMDEAYYLGRGQYLNKHGYKPHFELMCNHLRRVLDICKKYGLKPMIWSDMFFNLMFGGLYADGELDQNLLDLVPKDVTLIYWDYYSTSYEEYDKRLKSHLKFDNKIGFAGGAWKWSSIVPSTDHSMNVTKLALDACRANGIDTVFATEWGDNGAEASIYSILPVLSLFAEESYGTDDIDARVNRAVLAMTGYTTEEFLKMCDINRTTKVEPIVPHTNPGKYLFFQDVLMGLFDCHVNETFPAHFAQCERTLAELASRDLPVSYVFDTLAKLAHVLEIKCDIGIRLKAAYDNNDREALAKMANEEFDELLSRIEVFYHAFRTQWYNENRPGGFDVQDIRIGGLKQRIITAKDTVNAYLAGDIDRIEELEIERLPFDCRTPGEEKDINVDCNFWNYISTPNVNTQY